MPTFSRSTLRDYLNDALPDPETAAVERALRESAELRAELDAVRRESDNGEHTVGAVWRRERLSCPTRDQLGSFLLGAGDPDLGDYIDFHLQTVGCPYCLANFDDLKKLQDDAAEPVTQRRKRIYKSSAGVLRDVSRPA
jgi:hypothetical protein